MTETSSWVYNRFRHMKYIAFITRWLFSLCMPLLLLSSGIAWATNSLWIYETGFHDYDITKVTGLDESQLQKAAVGLIGYFNNSQEYIDITVEKNGQPMTLFKEKEVLHLKDVKGLFHLDYKILFFSLLYALIFFVVRFFWGGLSSRRQLARSALIGSFITLGLMLALGVGTLVGFNRLFWDFHLISFSNNYWLLDPKTDYLLMMFPFGFWYDVTLYCALATAGLALAVGAAGWEYLRISDRA